MSVTRFACISQETSGQQRINCVMVVTSSPSKTAPIMNASINAHINGCVFIDIPALGFSGVSFTKNVFVDALYLKPARRSRSPRQIVGLVLSVPFLVGRLHLNQPSTALPARDAWTRGFSRRHQFRRTCPRGHDRKHLQHASEEGS